MFVVDWALLAPVKSIEDRTRAARERVPAPRSRMGRMFTSCVLGRGSYTSLTFPAHGRFYAPKINCERQPAPDCPSPSFRFRKDQKEVAPLIVLSCTGKRRHQ